MRRVNVTHQGNNNALWPAGHRDMLPAGHALCSRSYPWHCIALVAIGSIGKLWSLALLLSSFPVVFRRVYLVCDLKDDLWLGRILSTFLEHCLPTFERTAWYMPTMLVYWHRFHLVLCSCSVGINGIDDNRMRCILFTMKGPKAMITLTKKNSLPSGFRHLEKCDQASSFVKTCGKFLIYENF